MLPYYIQVNLQFAVKINMRVLSEAVEALHETVEETQDEKQRRLAQQPIMALDIVLHYSATLR